MPKNHRHSEPTREGYVDVSRDEVAEPDWVPADEVEQEGPDEPGRPERQDAVANADDAGGSGEAHPAGQSSRRSRTRSGR